MAFVFGDMVIRVDGDTAKLVTFSTQVGGMCRVTLDEDMYDPSRTLLVHVRDRSGRGRVRLC